MPTAMQDLTRFLGNDGRIDEGMLVRYYRKEVRGWKNAQIVVDLYNELLEENVSIRWMQRMEQQNNVPIDQTRRWVLATLLSIPPAYLGLPALKPIIQLQDTVQIVVSTKAPEVDNTEYGSRLRELWRSNHANARKPDVIPEIVARIYALQEALLYGKEQQRKLVARLLCNYLILCGNVHRYQGYLSTAITYLNHALTLAREKGFYELYTRTLYLRGFAFFNRWTLWRNKEDRSDLLYAVRDLKAAQSFVESAHKHGIAISQSLKGAILAEGGRALAYNARDSQERLEAMNKLDQAGRIISASSFSNDDERFLRVDQEWYHIDKAEAYIANGWADSAFQELANVYKGDPLLHQRYLYAYLLEAEAHMVRGRIEIGIAHLENVMQVLNEETKRRHLNRIINTYESLNENEKYQKSPDVARLGVRVLRIVHPELFYSNT
ncbi:hypothetical protein EPA93_39220 [Ktedonosporobacter rubrisoli]|uniref:Tetratricopeptide repeat protein n=1 Tax=Ktedonosporobacter rubrisoli TaxID=2509675 RepID=A0A4P6K1I2_KTERU|nr:hypothetical protein [Ktedonosporobacter rubrisoli]QBD81682.1 hypothetical protein EPA93_39220 [Ktedonosporobacter rubrisoli]